MSSRAKRYCAIRIETTSGSGLGLIRIGSGLDECAFSVDALKLDSMRIECPMWTGLNTKDHHFRRSNTRIVVSGNLTKDQIRLLNWTDVGGSFYSRKYSICTVPFVIQLTLFSA